MNRADRMLSVLKDGRPRSRQEIFVATGAFFMTNNAAVELRDRGYDVLHTKEGRRDVYQLVGLLAQEGRVDAALLSERAGTDGERRQSARSTVSAPGGEAFPSLSAAPSAADDGTRTDVVPEPSLVPGQLTIDEVAA